MAATTVTTFTDTAYTLATDDESTLNVTTASSDDRKDGGIPKILCVETEIGYCVHRSVPWTFGTRCGFALFPLSGQAPLPVALPHLRHHTWRSFLTAVHVRTHTVFGPLRWVEHVPFFVALLVLVTMDSWKMRGGCLTALLVVLLLALSTIEWFLQPYNRPIVVVPVSFAVTGGLSSGTKWYMALGLWIVYVTVYQCFGLPRIIPARRELHIKMQALTEEWLPAFAQQGLRVEYIVDDPASWWKWSESYLLFRPQQRPAVLSNNNNNNDDDNNNNINNHSSNNNDSSKV